VEALLNTPQVRNMLDRMYVRSAERDAEAKQGLPADPGSLDTQQMADLLKDAPLAITRQVGELLYALGLSRRARLIVEFGASLGAPYQDHVRDPGNGYFSTLLPLDDGVELSVRAG
jgi:predicted O-methyltransferase YrrM